MTRVPFVRGMLHSETLLYSTYYAPRGRNRLYLVAGMLAERYLTPNDLLIGVIGTEGSGKSTLIKGLFSGLELTNDDEGVNIRPTPIYGFQPDDFFAPHTYHLDIRYELAFKQPFEIVESIKAVIETGRRVVVEHFDLIYNQLGFNAQILFGIGEEIIVARPSIFGPQPQALKKIVDNTLKYRKMAHTAEDITTFILAKDYKYPRDMYHSDVKHGFVVKFIEEPTFSIEELEQKVRAAISENRKVKYYARNQITIGDWVVNCSGVRTHVRNTSDIEEFRLVKKFIHDPIWKEYMLVGLVGKKFRSGIEDIAYIDDF